MNRFKGHLLFRIVLLALGLALLAGLVNYFGLLQVVSVLRGANGAWILAALGVYYLGALARALKWKNMLGTLGLDIGFRQVFLLYLVVLAIANITPVRSGELAAPVLLKKYAKSSTGGGFSLILVDRLVETAFLALIMLLAVGYTLYVFHLSPFMVIAFALAFVILLFMIAFLLLLFFSQKKTTGFLEALERAVRRIPLLSFMGARIEKARGELNAFYRGLSLFWAWGVLRFLIPLTALAWLFELLSFYFVIRSLVAASFLPVASSQIIAKGVGLASLIPGGVGSSNIGFTYLLSSGGYPAAAAAAGSVLVTCLFLGSVLVFALGSLFFIGPPTQREIVPGLGEETLMPTDPDYQDDQGEEAPLIERKA